MQAESQDKCLVQHLDPVDLLAPCTAMQFGTLELMHSVSGRLSIGVWYNTSEHRIGKFGHCAFRAVFLDCGVINKIPPPRLHVHKPAHSHTGDPIAVAVTYRLAAVSRNSICRKCGTQSSRVTDLCVQAQLGRCRPDETTQRLETGPSRDDNNPSRNASHLTCHTTNYFFTMIVS